MKTLSISETKTNLNALISATETAIISKNGDPVAALVPMDEFKEMYRAKKRLIDIDAIERARKASNGEEASLSHEEVMKMIEDIHDEKLDL